MGISPTYVRHSKATGSKYDSPLTTHHSLMPECLNRIKLRRAPGRVKAEEHTNPRRHEERDDHRLDLQHSRDRRSPEVLVHGRHPVHDPDPGQDAEQPADRSMQYRLIQYMNN